MAARERDKRATLIDRCALAFLSAICAFPLAALAWFGLCSTLAQSGPDVVPSFRWVLAFTGLMALLGFLLMENLVLNLISAIWGWLDRVWRSGWWW